jgi:hypothetical protein
VLGLGFQWNGTVGDAQSAVQSYYQAIQRQDYPTAYSHVDPHATVTVNGQDRKLDSVDSLASIARAADLDAGAITGYTLVDGQFERGTKIVDLTERVTRGSGTRDVHIRIGFSNGTWRILRMDSA